MHHIVYIHNLSQASHHRSPPGSCPPYMQRFTVQGAHKITQGQRSNIHELAKD